MAKPQAQRGARSHPPKTKSSKGRRSGIYKRYPQGVDKDGRTLYGPRPPLRMQTPYSAPTVATNADGTTQTIYRVNRVPHAGKTEMRLAFENIVPPRARSRTVGKILRVLRTRAGTFGPAGGRALRGQR
jgi:hypothetical protein